MLLQAFARLPYHAEIAELCNEIPSYFAESNFSADMIKKNLEFSSRYLHDKCSTVHYLELLAEYSVSTTWALYIEKQDLHKDLSPQELAMKLRADMLAEGGTRTDSERIMGKLHWVMNEKSFRLVPSTHKIFTRLTKLFVCDIAAQDETQGRNFFKFFRAFNPSWKFDRALDFIAVSILFLLNVHCLSHNPSTLTYLFLPHFSSFRLCTRTTLSLARTTLSLARTTLM